MNATHQCSRPQYTRALLQLALSQCTCIATTVKHSAASGATTRMRLTWKTDSNFFGVRKSEKLKSANFDTSQNNVGPEIIEFYSGSVLFSRPCVERSILCQSLSVIKPRTFDRKSTTRKSFKLVRPPPSVTLGTIRSGCPQLERNSI